MATSKKLKLVESEIKRSGSDNLYCYEHSGCVIAIQFSSNVVNRITPLRTTMVSDILYQVVGFADSVHIRVLKNKNTITRKSQIAGLAKFFDVEITDITSEGNYLSELFVIRDPQLVLMISLKFNLS